MSFGDGDLHARLEDMTRQRDILVALARMMAKRMQDIDYPKYGPASWGHIVKELRKAGIEIED